jgi:two-component system response regulator AtoC
MLPSVEDGMDIPNGNRKQRPRPESGGPAPALFDLDLMGAVRTDACVLLTGKEDAARTLAYKIHSLSGWRHGPFTIVDCARPGETVERDLVGLFTETEASNAREPYPRLAQAGTVLLQNVGRLTPPVQSRIADRLVHFCRTRRSGSPRRRLMASTSEPLLPRVLDGTFDDQLFYRLNVIHVVLPSDTNPEDSRDVPDEEETVPDRAPRRTRVSEHRAVGL